MKKLVIILALLALVAGGALGGLGLAGMGPLAGYIAGKPAEAATASAAPAPPRLIDLETIGIPLFEGNAVRARLFLNVRLAVPPEMGEKLAAQTPRFQDAFLSDLLAYMPRHLRERDRVDVALVQKRLLKVARKVAGDAAVHEVTIAHAFER